MDESSREKGLLLRLEREKVVGERWGQWFRRGNFAHSRKERPCRYTWYSLFSPRLTGKGVLLGPHLSTPRGDEWGTKTSDGGVGT